jgi:cytoskeletal protein CcmA (bactofilin family)
MVAPADAPLVPEGGVFEGEVAILGDTRIDGRVEGSLRGPGRVELGPQAEVIGPLECDEVDSEGAIRGPILARRRVRLRAGARLEGDLTAPLVEVEEDAHWTGRARVGGLPREGGCDDRAEG